MLGDVRLVYFIYPSLNSGRIFLISPCSPILEIIIFPFTNIHSLILLCKCLILYLIGYILQDGCKFVILRSAIELTNQMNIPLEFLFSNSPDIHDSAGMSAEKENRILGKNPQCVGHRRYSRLFLTL